MQRSGASGNRDVARHSLPSAAIEKFKGRPKIGPTGCCNVDERQRKRDSLDARVRQRDRENGKHIDRFSGRHVVDTKSRSVVVAAVWTCPVIDDRSDAHRIADTGANRAGQCHVERFTLFEQVVVGNVDDDRRGLLIRIERDRSACRCKINSAGCRARRSCIVNGDGQ